MHYSSTPMPQAQQTIGILVVNLGTPDAPDTPSVRRYLKEFLSDPRVIETPRWLWWPILNLVILRIRPARSAEGYKAVWTEQGSPILAISRQQTALLQEQMNDIDGAEVFVELAMRYGQPSVKAGLDRLQQQGVSKLLVLPMYPQYCAATTASVFDAVSDQLQRRRWIPETRFINQYYQRPDYISALAASVRESWEKHGKGEKLVLSYHGIPKAYIDKGDPYLSQCEHTTALLQEALQLTDDEVLTVFQSRVGRQEWLKPYCDETLKALPASGVKSIDIISPAFSADCLETLEELEVENRAYFMQAGGERYQYIPALNARND
ncbi:MAG: ferrochelatase, partial [Gammaproteobacteria bacterium]|nr:ferrochelatase [Gammaproteobacteria bacterium]